MQSEQIAQMFYIIIPVLNMYGIESGLFVLLFLLFLLE